MNILPSHFVWKNPILTNEVRLCNIHKCVKMVQASAHP